MLNTAHQRAYWILQASGWALFFVLNQILFVSILDLVDGLIVNTFMVGVGFVLSHLYRSLIHYQGWKEYSIKKLVFRVLFSSILLGAVWTLIAVPFNIYFLGEAGMGATEQDVNQPMSPVLWVFAIWMNFSIVIFGWSLIYFGYHFFDRLKATEVEKWRLELAVKEAELMALKAQINPHFIFNSLNNIRSLILEDAERSRDMITHLSDLMRYAIQFSKQETVSVGRELEVVQNYLDLESIQFEERLNYDIYCEPGCEDARIPPMVIQLLVENAIKHSLSSLEGGGVIRVKVFKENQELKIEVLNSGRIKPFKAGGSGIGLRNASDRLKILFGEQSNLHLENTPDGMVSAKVSIPLHDPRPIARPEVLTT
jgi:signal transduction histidine kinase